MKSLRLDFPRIRELSKVERSKIEEDLKNNFGIKKIPGVIFKKGKERLFLFTGDLNKFPLYNLEEKIIIEKIGIYFAKIIVDNGEEKTKLSIEGTQILSDQITENVFELDEDQLQIWMEGKELYVKTGKRGFLAMKYKDNFLGSGKASENRITNFVPKNRRLKEKVKPQIS